MSCVHRRGAEPEASKVSLFALFGSAKPREPASSLLQGSHEGTEKCPRFLLMIAWHVVSYRTMMYLRLDVVDSDSCGLASNPHALEKSTNVSCFLLLLTFVAAHQAPLGIASFSLKFWPTQIEPQSLVRAGWRKLVIPLRQAEKYEQQSNP